MIFLQTLQLSSKRGEYPILAELILNENNIRAAGTLVLFAAPKVGQVVYCPTGLWEIGHFSEQWIPVTDEASWKIIPQYDLVIATRI